MTKSTDDQQHRTCKTISLESQENFKPLSAVSKGCTVPCSYTTKNTAHQTIRQNPMTMTKSHTHNRHALLVVTDFCGQCLLGLFWLCDRPILLVAHVSVVTPKGSHFITSYSIRTRSAKLIMNPASKIMTLNQSQDWLRQKQYLSQQQGV